MFIFISYSRQDKVYVNKLEAYLIQNRLPVWLDKQIDYGREWPRVIEKHVEKCQVFLLVMSPRSKESDWVLRELTHAQDLKKLIIPLLLEGESWLQVAELQRFDVKGNKLPPDSFIKSVRSIVSAVSLPSDSDPESVKKTKNSQYENDFKVFLDIRYKNLERFLANGKWKDADEETLEIMLQIANKRVIHYLRKEDIENFPCEDLLAIDQLWIKYSKGLFGFSMQSNIFGELGGFSAFRFDERDRAWMNFGTKVGWRKYDWTNIKWTWLSYDQIFGLTWDKIGFKRQKGNLPRKCYDRAGEIQIPFNQIQSRLWTCKYPND